MRFFEVAGCRSASNGHDSTDSQVAGGREKGRGVGREFGKKGQMAEGIHMIYRLMMVSLVAFVVFGAGSFVYTYYIDVRDVEARILAREVVECLVEDGVLDLRGDVEGKIEDCGIASDERIYVGVEVVDGDGKNIAKFSEGDSGALWIRDLFGKAIVTGNAVMGHENIEGIAMYKPGYYEGNYSVFVLDDDDKFEGVMMMEVLVNYGDE
ncbi:hypothetical protein KAT36_00940 [Candidatus Pacearchaeota archaeon]|nr:hypothetical protein [Candidatus Pacearchaeota archaeon]